MKSTSLKDGHGITISFGDHSDLFLYVDPTTVSPPGIDGGDPIVTTTHTNTTYGTKAPRSLKDISNGSFEAAYDPDAYDELLAAVNDNNLITWTFPDGATIAAYGFLANVEFNELQEGELPTITGEIVITNDNAGTETGPAYTEGS